MAAISMAVTTKEPSNAEASSPMRPLLKLHEQDFPLVEDLAEVEVRTLLPDDIAKQGIGSELADLVLHGADGFRAGTLAARIATPVARTHAPRDRSLSRRCPRDTELRSKGVAATASDEPGISSKVSRA